MNKFVVMAILLLLPVCAFALDTDPFCAVGVNGIGTITDVSGNISAQLEAEAKFDIGVMIEEDYGFYGSLSAGIRMLAKQYSRFVDVPDYKQFSIGGGGFLRRENFLVSADIGLVGIVINEDWEIGAQLSVCPRFVVSENDNLKYSIGIPVEFLCSGNIKRGGFGVAFKMEVFK